MQVFPEPLTEFGSVGHIRVVVCASLGALAGMSFCMWHFAQNQSARDDENWSYFLIVLLGAVTATWLGSGARGRPLKFAILYLAGGAILLWCLAPSESYIPSLKRLRWQASDWGGFSPIWAAAGVVTGATLNAIMRILEERWAVKERARNARQQPPR